MFLGKAPRNAALFFSISAFIAILALVPSASAQVQQGNASFNATLNETISQLVALNNSAYLVFYPSVQNITSKISHAEKIYNEDPSTAFSLLSSARSEIAAQKAKLESYFAISLVVMVALTAIFGYILYDIMKPVRRKRLSVSAKRRRKGG
jgi:predicted PurR-regulated permease PerM